MGWFPLVFTILGYLAHVLRFPFFFRVGFYHPGRFINDYVSNHRYSCCNIGVGRAGYDTSKYGIRGYFFGLDILTLNVLSIATPNPNGNEGHWTLTMCDLYIKNYIPRSRIIIINFYKLLLLLLLLLSFFFLLLLLLYYY